jgi:hypothetical protein
MPVSARDVRRKVFNSNTVLLHNFHHAPEPEPQEADVTIAPNLLSKFAQEFTDHVQIQYVESEDENEPPVQAIFEVAHAVHLTALVNGWHEMYWTPRKIAKAHKDGAFEVPLIVELIRGNHKFCEFRIAWTDVSTVALIESGNYSPAPTHT